MKIIKHFRKYSRVLLLVFMSLLLVVFLVGDVISRASRRSANTDAQVGTAFGDPVYLSQLRMAKNDMDVATGLGMRPYPIFATSDRDESATAAFLLMDEARRAGVRVSRDQVISSLRDSGLAPRIEAIRKNTNRSLNSIYDAVARYLAPFHLLNYEFAAAVGESEPRLERDYRDQTQTADVRISVISSAAFQRHVAEPTEEEIAAEFEAGKNRSDVLTGDKLEFGYQLPARVRLEYLTVDPAAFESGMVVRDSELQRYYDQYKQKYRRKIEGPSISLDQKADFVIPTLDEVREQVKRDVRSQKAIQAAQQLVARIRAEAGRPWAALSPDQSPPAAAITPFDELQRRFSDQYAVIYRRTNLLEAAALRREPGIGTSQLGTGTNRVPFGAAAMNVVGLVEADASEGSPGPLRVGEPSRPLYRTQGTDAAGRPRAYQWYIFRVIEAAPPGPPASVDEVRERVVANIKRLRAHEMAGTAARKLADAARGEGLEAAVAHADALRVLLRDPKPASQPATDSQPAASQPVRNPLADRYAKLLDVITPPNFKRQASFIQNVGYVSDLNAKIFELADASTTSQGAHRVAVLPIANQDKWVVAELVKLNPLYRGEFEARRDQISDSGARSTLFLFQSTWFDSKSILARAHYQPLKTDEP